MPIIDRVQLPIATQVFRLELLLHHLLHLDLQVTTVARGAIHHLHLGRSL